ncbi:gliding motility-associated C-terminal domain-containing protein [Hymenobacter taeanensis]|uniref:Gliding motility-associated C-terminal domain-containing protein n=1 Tax=Hymenobacter taeanensis TaxID=2735321 RepID=A0A6M6BKI0_9BACT|nr:MULTISPECIES: gliding motility-associated C-terminal domain-containing protein [Hymenobacter]QJX47893.1 gliding motility-associated C-terminal domain-containing protein [Hymenobacter taeanensis]UOQ82665.1 gliding motility-associated C-terminal domain-containing protein [Hymenobacter sp. 5414T-23]
MKLPLLNRAARLGLVLLVLVLAYFGLTPAAQATHLRAGDIQAKTDTTAARNPRRIFFKMVIYESNVNTSVSQTDATIFFGDGTVAQKIPRASRTPVGCDGTTFRLVFYFDHTYPAVGQYTVHFIGEFRSTGVRNMTASNQQTFYINSRITIDPALGINQSPILNAPAFDRASRNQVFLHNPAASDADGDSLSYELLPSQYVPNGVEGVLAQTGNDKNTPKPLPCINFVFPNAVAGVNAVQVPYVGPPVGVPGVPAIFDQNPLTGQIVWNAPLDAGDYNFAFKVREWRRVPGARARLIGEYIRDMQVTVGNNNNIRPTITVPTDLCVIAGTPVTGLITATDPDNQQVILSAYGGVLPRPATFVQNTTGPPTARGTFTWSPDCSNIQSEPHQILFKAEDRPANNCGASLIDERVWRITVVGPPPQNLRVAPSGNTAQLSWDSYACQNPGAQILIFRKENPSSFTPGTCETGIPASAGYTQIGSVSVGSRTFVDDRNGLGLERGKNYCYRIYVQFARPAGGASIASNEACLTLVGRSPRLTNVTVDRTDAVNGQITVRWTRPAPLGSFNAPFGYRLYRAIGQNPTFSPTAVPLRTITNLNDTVFVDTGLNTTDNAYSYKLEFFSNTLPTPNSPVSVETAEPASSVRVNTTADPLANTISLNWTYNVPWDNTRYPATIYRRDGLTGAFVPIAKVTGTATNGTYLDRGTTAKPLVKGNTYCYYIKTKGAYAIAPNDSLINLSQERCVALAPVLCTPVLTLKPTNCDSLASRLFELPATPVNGQVYTNYLSWTLSAQPVADCSRDVASYIIYYAPTANDSLRVLTTVPGSQTTYAHQNLASAEGCYAVRAVDAAGTRSLLSNKECKDNCLLFLLPNIFTPNGDGKNDTFRPKVFSPIRRTKVQIFNRWGVKVYESDKDPLINWSGSGSGESGSGSKVSEGMYFYQAEVEFGDANRTKRTFKGWVQVNR